MRKDTASVGKGTACVGKHTTRRGRAGRILLHTIKRSWLNSNECKGLRRPSMSCATDMQLLHCVAHVLLEESAVICSKSESFAANPARSTQDGRHAVVSKMDWRGGSSQWLALGHRFFALAEQPNAF